MTTTETTTPKTNGHVHKPDERPELVRLDLDLIDAHPHQPRKTFTEIDELAASIVEHGLLEPIMVRPKGKRYELVFGERRCRAARKAKLSTILAIVRVLDDAQCEQIMVVENTKRSDLHPLEEAEGYERLHKVHGMTVEAIAAKVNKSPAQIYARMKLCALCKEARTAFYDDKLTASTALYIARIPVEKLQIDALKELTRVDPHGHRDLPGAREALAIIQNRYMLRLAEAPFDRADAVLVAKAGACTSCPKRTGNQAELFADVKSADVCTDPVCFRVKRDAEWDRRVKAAPESGIEILTDKQAKKLFPYGSQLAYGSDFVDLDATTYEKGKAMTYRKKLGKELPPITIARDPEGNILELVKKATVESRSRSTPTPAEKKRNAADRAATVKEKTKARLEEKTNALALAAIVEKAETKIPNAEFYRALLVAFADRLWGEELLAPLRARSLTTEADEKRTDHHALFDRAIAKLSEKTLRGMLVEMVGRASFELRHDAKHRNAFERMCDLYRVDPKKFVAEAKASVGAKP